MSYEAPKSEVRDHEPNEYRDSTTLTQWTTWLIYAQLAMAVIGLWSGWEERTLLQSFAMGAFDSQEEVEAAANASDSRQRMIGILAMMVSIAGGVLTLCWIYRMCHNVSVRARRMSYSPGWAVGWYFIPFANIWKPYQAMKEIWEESVRQAGPQGREGGALLGTWWMLWLASAFVGNAALRASLRIDDVNSALAANTYSLTSDVISLPLCTVLLVMVRRLYAMQQYANENPQPPELDMRELGANGQ